MEHNKVQLIGHTQWSSKGAHEEANIMAYCARVSNPSNQSNWQTEGKLLSYCAKNAHWSVFEMSNVIMEIETTRDIARQILRHRSFHFQEFSQRYAEPGKELGHVEREARLQDKKNRQNSLSTKDEGLVNAFSAIQQSVMNSATAAYDWAIKSGIAKEQARAVMPEGMTMSRMYMNGTVRDWYHFCQVRRGNGAQLECQDVANKCWKILTELYPFLLEVETRRMEDDVNVVTVEVLKEELQRIKAKLQRYQNRFGPIELPASKELQEAVDLINREDSK